MQFAPEYGPLLAQRTVGLAASARELALFGETDPDMAGACGVEVCALEARSLLAGGVLSRISAAAAAAVQKRTSVVLAAEDVETLSRLEAVVSLGSSRIDLKLAALNAEASQAGLANIGSMIGLATGVVGFIKSVL